MCKIEFYIETRVQCHSYKTSSENVLGKENHIFNCRMTTAKDQLTKYFLSERKPVKTELEKTCKKMRLTVVKYNNNNVKNKSEQTHLFL